MKHANIHEAKTQFSSLVDLAINGEEVIICKHSKPVARLTPYKEAINPHRMGVWEGKVNVSPNFDRLPETFIKYFE